MSADMPVESPCSGVCIINAERGYCHGCARTLAEISAWLSYTPAERKRIMRALPARLAAPDDEPRLD